MILLERSWSFSSSHLYRRSNWSDAQNAATFGKCAYLPAHGHNYRLTVRVAGEIDPATGFAMDLPALDRMVRAAVVDRLDHRHINDAVAEEFGDGRKIPTSECLATWIAGEVGRALPERNRLVEIRLAEDDRLAAIWRPG
jgi:6-pyruvoyltetrahydropterin/6-carboxytetrahydropterin synthase